MENDDMNDLLNDIKSTLPKWGKQAGTLFKDKIAPKAQELLDRGLGELETTIRENPEDSRNTDEYWRMKGIAESLDGHDYLVQYACEKHGITEPGMQKLYASLIGMHKNLVDIEPSTLRDSGLLSKMTKFASSVCQRTVGDEQGKHFTKVYEKYLLDSDFQTSCRTILYMVLAPALESELQEPSAEYTSWLEQAQQE